MPRRSADRVRRWRTCLRRENEDNCCVGVSIRKNKSYRCSHTSRHGSNIVTPRQPRAYGTHPRRRGSPRSMRAHREMLRTRDKQLSRERSVAVKSETTVT